MFRDETTEKILENNKHIPVLLLHRSVEYAESNMELFDILFYLNKLLKKNNFPIIWDDSTRRWIKAKDLIQYKDPRRNK